MRATALPVLLLLTLLCPVTRGFAGSEAVHCEASDGRGILDDAYLSRLRTCAWRLLEPLARQSSGFPDEGTWTRADRILPDLEPRGTLRRAEELTAQRAARPVNEPELYEMTFFNGIAAGFIESERLNRPETTEALLSRNIRDVQFPAGSAALKTFWYHLPKGQVLDVRVWNWNATSAGTTGASPLTVDVSRLERQCVVDTAATGRKQGAKGRQCLVASEAFYTIAVSAQDAFRCSRAQCAPLAQGDTLVLVGMHIASKQMPEWLWATWWWQGRSVSGGESWTCGAAQRPHAIGASGPWANYAMNVTASFRYERAAVAADDPCGAPAALPGGQERRATYNPFVEAREENGLKSSCVDCHSRASTKSAAELVTPGVEETGGPTVASFEGHVRLDYLWSIRRSLDKTRTLPRDR